MMILGILRPVNGSISIDGALPEHYFGQNRIQVGYVGPEPYLIRGTLRENLTYGIKFAVSDAEIQSALELASLGPLIAKVGLEYEIFEDQSGLSAGQKQRLCLARAILNKPHVLVLDEASANLDHVTEDEITHSIARLKGKTTTIIVSHRMGLLKFSDEILRLESHKQFKSFNT